MTLVQKLITIAMCSLSSIITRFISFGLFSEKRPVPKYVAYLGNALPLAVFGLLVIYCVKNVSFLTLSSGGPTTIAILVTAGLHLWKGNMFLSMLGGTACYMLLLQFIF